MASKSSQDKTRKKVRARNARSVTDILSGVLEPVLARKTGMKLDLLRSWAELAGPDYAQTTRPEKIDWPRRRNENDPFEPGVLVVACEPSAALFFQHEQKQVVERVNLFFGFEAIKRLKVLQKPVAKSDESETNNQPVRLTSDDRNRLDKLIEEIDDAEIRKKLAKLGEGVFTKNSGNRD